ncbi:MAG: hypothetical protein ABW250_13350 [Pyrinomonadaceae bacterium]
MLRHDAFSRWEKALVCCRASSAPEVNPMTLLTNIAARAGRRLRSRKERLFAAPLALLALCLSSAAAFGQTPPVKQKVLRKADKLLAKLQELDGLSAGDVNDAGKVRVIGELILGVRAEVAGLPEGDIQTDVATATRFYEAALRGKREVEDVPRSCQSEKPGRYRRLCEDARGEPRPLLLAKARLHALWAKAVVDWHRGATDGATREALRELQSERETDRILAGQAAALLRRLAGAVRVYDSLNAFEERGQVAGVTLPKFEADFEAVNAPVWQILDQLPESRTRSLLRNARQAYADGLFWWRKTYPRAALTVAVSSYAAPDGASVVGINPQSINHTVVANWRHALRYTQRAEEAVDAAPRGAAYLPPADAAEVTALP